MLFTLIENNFVAVVITSFLILFILTNNNFEKRTNHLFLAAASCVLLLIITEAWEAQLALQPTYAPMRVLLSVIGYSLRPLIPYFLMMIVKRYSGGQFILYTLPAACNILIAMSAFFSDISFSYTPSNAFVRGPLGYIPFGVAAFYIGVLLVDTVQNRRKGGGVETLIVSAIVIVAFLSTVMESFFHLRFIQNPSIATSITFYYLFLHSNQNNRDLLTGALTRRRFYLDAEKYSNSLSAVISLDLNNLKTLNDQYGHVAGDKALVEVTNTIKKHMGPHASLYRIGGDEFSILCYKLSEEKVQALISALHNDLEKTPYQCAIGYALFSNHANFDFVCHLADNAMYVEKHHMKNEASKLTNTNSLITP